MIKKLKKINWSKIDSVLFGLVTLVTLLSIYFSDRNALIVISFFVIAMYNIYTLIEEFVKAYRVNTNINMQRYFNERGLKKEQQNE